MKPVSCTRNVVHFNNKVTETALVEVVVVVFLTLDIRALY